MSVKYIGMMIFIFVLLQICLIPLGNAGVNEHAQHNLNVLSSWGIVQEDETFGVIKYVKAPLNYFGALFDIVTENRDNPVFEGDAEIVRWVLMAPLLGMVGFGLVIIFTGMLRRTIG